MRSALMLSFALVIAALVAPYAARAAESEVVITFEEADVIVVAVTVDDETGVICVGEPTDEDGQQCSDNTTTFTFAEDDVIEAELPELVADVTFDFGDEDALVFYADGTTCVGTETSQTGEVCDNGEVTMTFVEDDTIVVDLDETLVIAMLE